MINTIFIENQISQCEWSDVICFNGEDNPATPAYSEEEQNAMQLRKIELERQLSEIEKINNR